MALIKGWTKVYDTGNTNSKNMRVDKKTNKIIYRYSSSNDIHVYDPVLNVKEGTYGSGVQASENNRNVTAGDGYAFVISPYAGVKVKRLDLKTKEWAELGAFSATGSHYALGYDPNTKYLFFTPYDNATMYKIGSGLGGTGTGIAVQVASSPNTTFSSLIGSANKIWEANAGSSGIDFKSYNPVSNTWNNSHAKPPVSCHANIGEIDNQYIMTISTDNYVYLYEISANKWTKDIILPTTPGSADYLSIQWLNGYVYVMVKGVIYKSTNRIAGNSAPTKPASFTSEPSFSSMNLTGETVTLSWKAATDPEGDAIHYQLEFYDGTSWLVVNSNITTTSYIHALPSCNTEKAQYRVSAIDSKEGISDYLMSNTFKVHRYLILLQSNEEVRTYKNGNWQTI